MQPINLPKRKRNRLEGFDYSSNGAYFITICTDKRKQILSRIVGAIHESPKISLKPSGQIAEKYILKLPQRFDLRIDAYVIMPNHIHLLIGIDNPDIMRAIHESPLRHRSIISKAIGYLKMNASRDLHTAGVLGKIWQRSFHDHIIRTEKDYNKIYEYICCNPQLWQDDCFYAEG